MEMDFVGTKIAWTVKYRWDVQGKGISNRKFYAPQSNFYSAQRRFRKNLCLQQESKLYIFYLYPGFQRNTCDFIQLSRPQPALCFRVLGRSVKAAPCLLTSACFQWLNMPAISGWTGTRKPVPSLNYGNTVVHLSKATHCAGEGKPYVHSPALDTTPKEPIKYLEPRLMLLLGLTHYIHSGTYLSLSLVLIPCVDIISHKRHFTAPSIPKLTLIQ